MGFIVGFFAFFVKIFYYIMYYMAKLMYYFLYYSFLAIVFVVKLICILINKLISAISKKNTTKLSTQIRSEKHVYIPPLLSVDMQKIDTMEGHTFEYLVADLLKSSGYYNVEVTPGSGDRGADVIGYDPSGRKMVFQCKRYASNVGNAAVQEAYAAKGIYNADFAVVVTNSYFTKQATEDGQKLGVFLWDRDRFVKLLETYKDNKESLNINEKTEEVEENYDSIEYH